MNPKSPKHLKNGSPWVLMENRLSAHICCDCGLVHFIHVEKVKKGRCTTWWYRDDYQTKKRRRRKKK